MEHLPRNYQQNKKTKKKKKNKAKNMHVHTDPCLYIIHGLYIKFPLLFSHIREIKNIFVIRLYKIIKTFFFVL